MSNPNSLLASLDCPSSTAVEELSNHVIFQDAHQYQDVPGVSSLNGLNSNTEVQNPPTQTQSQDDPGHQKNKETNMPPAPDDQQETKAQASKKHTLYMKRRSGPYNVNSRSSKPKNTSLNLLKICPLQTLGPDTGNCACESKRSFSHQRICVLFSRRGV